MKKRLYGVVCLCSLVFIMLYVCGKQQIGTTAERETTADDAETVIFLATVVELAGNNILVEPLEGSVELNSADAFHIANIGNIELHIGDIVEIEYNGGV